MGTRVNSPTVGRDNNVPQASPKNKSKVYLPKNSTDKKVQKTSNSCFKKFFINMFKKISRCFKRIFNLETTSYSGLTSTSISDLFKKTHREDFTQEVRKSSGNDGSSVDGSKRDGQKAPSKRDSVPQTEPTSKQEGIEATQNNDENVLNESNKDGHKASNNGDNNSQTEHESKQEGIEATQNNDENVLNESNKDGHKASNNGDNNSQTEHESKQEGIEATQNNDENVLNESNKDGHNASNNDDNNLQTEPTSKQESIEATQNNDENVLNESNKDGQNAAIQCDNIPPLEPASQNMEIRQYRRRSLFSRFNSVKSREKLHTSSMKYINEMKLDFTKENKKVFGIANHGNTCYLNSALQILKLQLRKDKNFKKIRNLQQEKNETPLEFEERVLAQWAPMIRGKDIHNHNAIESIEKFEDRNLLKEVLFP